MKIFDKSRIKAGRKTKIRAKYSNDSDFAVTLASETHQGMNILQCQYRGIDCRQSWNSGPCEHSAKMSFVIYSDFVRILIQDILAHYSHFPNFSRKVKSAEPFLLKIFSSPPSEIKCTTYWPLSRTG